MVANKLTRGQRTSAAALIAVALAIPAEGLRTIAYRDPVGIPTICFGSTRGVQMGDRATVQECHRLLSEEMLQAIYTVERCVPGLPIKVLAAFADTVYNAGPTIVCSTTGSTARKLLLAQDYDGACLQLGRWNKARVAGALVELPGLTKRRAAATKLCVDWRVDPLVLEPAFFTAPAKRAPAPAWRPMVSIPVAYHVEMTA